MAPRPQVLNLHPPQPHHQTPGDSGAHRLRREVRLAGLASPAGTMHVGQSDWAVAEPPPSAEVERSTLLGYLEVGCPQGPCEPPSSQG